MKVYNLNPAGKFRPHIAKPIVLFLIAKLMAYTALGSLLGAVGSVLQLTPATSAILYIGIGVFMIAISHPEKLLSAAGGFVGSLLVFFASRQLLGDGAGLMVAASMGASAVLLFAVPHGALAQPWTVLGGHLLSAAIGVTCARWIPDPLFAAPLAVGLAIGAMHYLRCVHPPGGATASDRGDRRAGGASAWLRFPSRPSAAQHREAAARRSGLQQPVSLAALSRQPGATAGRNLLLRYQLPTAPSPTKTSCTPCPR